VTEIDTVGAWLAWRFARDHRRRDHRRQRAGAAADRRGAQSAATPTRSHPPRPAVQRVPEAVGELVIGWGHGTVGVIGFLGAMLCRSGI
jgi:phospholipid/cholesterol/gamma-HCH transport system permease protein